MKVEAIILKLNEACYQNLVTVAVPREGKIIVGYMTKSYYNEVLG